MSNLIAYIPTVNQRHLNWFEKHRVADLYLIPQETAQMLLPRLERNMAAVATELVARFVRSTSLVRNVEILSLGQNGDLKGFDPAMLEPTRFILADEDVSRVYAEKFLLPLGHTISYEMIWARWDMTAVTAQQPVLPDLTITTDELDRQMMNLAVEQGRNCPDWWRQIGAVAVTARDEVVVAACTHMPNEYETYIFGDPGINRDAGQPGKYTSRHAEQGIIAHCARYGVPLEGARLYVTTFPCDSCARELADAGIKKVLFMEGYSTLNALDVFRTRRVELIQVKTP